MKWVILYLLLVLSPCVFSQKKENPFLLEALGATLFDSERWFNHNEEEGYFYGEFRAGYKFNRYLELNAFVGYQRRYYGYFAQAQNGSLYLLHMERHYLPIGINFRIYLSEFFYEKLKLWKKKGKWDIYNQIGFAILQEKDKRDNREEFFRNQGAYVPYYLYPYVQRDGQKFFIYVAGIRYNFSNALGLFIEGGEGARSNLQIGLSVKL